VPRKEKIMLLTTLQPAISSDKGGKGGGEKRGNAPSLSLPEVQEEKGGDHGPEVKTVHTPFQSRKFKDAEKQIFFYKKRSPAPSKRKKNKTGS